MCGRCLSAALYTLHGLSSSLEAHLAAAVTVVAPVRLIALVALSSSALRGANAQ